MKKIIIVLFTFSFISVNGQDFSGKVFYKTKSKFVATMDSTQVSSKEQMEINEMLRKRFEKEYVLIFDKVQSVYVEQQILEPVKNGDIGLFSFGGSDIFYRNNLEGLFINQREFFGKRFLIKDESVKWEWKIGNETKSIGKYTCYKATTNKLIKKQNKNASDSTAVKVEIIVVTAWFTPQIPIPFGPSNYWGLPGLILELNDGSQTIVTNKLVLNPDKIPKIKKPKKGKVVSQVEYDKIVKRRMEQIKLMNKSRKKDNTIDVIIN